jgi:hypothetical protein
MSILDQEINEAGLKEINFRFEYGLGNVEQIWTHPDGIKVYKLINSTEWHVNTIFAYDSIDYKYTIRTFRQLRDIYLKYLSERQKELARWE